MNTRAAKGVCVIASALGFVAVGVARSDILPARDMDGAGLAIAVIDDGIYPDHPSLAGKVVGQACFSTEDSTNGVSSLCPGGKRLPTGEVVDLSSDAATECNSGDDGCSHGTFVAALAAGREYGGGPNRLDIFSGVAKGAAIVAIQAFSRFNREVDCFGSAPCFRSFRSSQLRALTWVEAQVLAQASTGTGPRIVAVVMAVGSGQYGSPCDNDPLAIRIRELGELGVGTFVAAGNGGLHGAVSSPGCIVDAITVGAVNKDGTLAEFSNTSELVDLVAVGVDVVAAWGKFSFRKLSGTSVATPTAAGVFTVLYGAFSSSNSASVARQIMDVMKKTGRPVMDPFTGITTPAVDLGRAYQNLDTMANSGALGISGVPASAAVHSTQFQAN